MSADISRATPATTPFALPHTVLAPAVAGPVLLAADGRAPSDAAAIAARRAAERLGTTIDVVAVLEPLPVYAAPPAVPRVPPEYETQRHAALHGAVVGRLEPVLGSREHWHLAVAYGPVARTIADTAHERGTGLIVLGTGGHRVRDRLLGEEVSVQVARHARCPVLAVAPDLAGPIRRAVVGTDFSAASVRAAMAALALLESRPDGGLLTLVHVRPPFEGEIPILGAWVTQYDDDIAERLVRLRDLLRPYVPEGVTVETRNRMGTLPATLLEAADEIGADLVSVGTHGAGWVERLLVGSVATGTLRHAGRSVLVTPPPNAIDRLRLELGVTHSVTFDRADDWPGALDGFTQRNTGRPARLDIRDDLAGVQSTEAVGYRLVGAAYDRHDERLELMLGEDRARARRLTHTIPDVQSIKIVAPGDGERDELLTVEDRTGDTTLTFLDG